MNNTNSGRIREITVLCALTDFDTKKINSQLIWTVTNTGSYDEFRKTLSECLSTAQTAVETARMISDAETRAEKILDNIDARNTAADHLHRITLITELDPVYPAMLNDLADDRPVLLFMMGSPAQLSADTIAIIGSRWPTEAGITAGNTLTDSLITQTCKQGISEPQSIRIDRTNTDLPVQAILTNPANLPNRSDSAASSQAPIIVSGSANCNDQSVPDPAASSQDYEPTHLPVIVSGLASCNDRSASRTAASSQDSEPTRLPVIVSGLANGCDTLGHRAALRNGVPTVAVLPGGFDHIVPANNKNLAEEILASRGALLTECLPETEVRNESYLRRDRLIAALSKAVAVIQCDLKSGTMYTVNCASRLTRPVCALSIPASADPATFTGNTHIIENNIGAPIIDPATDVPAFLETVRHTWKRPPESTEQLRFI